MLAFSAFILYRDLASEEQEAMAALSRRATVAASAIGYEVDSVYAELRTFSLTDSVRAGDVAAAYALAVRLVESDPRIGAITLTDASGVQRFHTHRPLGSPLPASNFTAANQLLFRGAPRIVSPLMAGSVTGRPGVQVAIPLDMGPAGTLALRASVKLAAIGKRLNEQAWPGDWTATVIDQSGVVIARSREPERLVGQTAPSKVLETVRTSKGVFRVTTRDGIASVAAAAPVPGTGWHIVVGRPVAALDAQLRDSMTLLLTTWVFYAALGIVGAVLFAQSAARQLRGVADAYARDVPVPTDSSIQEIAEVAGALAVARRTAAEAFTEITRAREQALAQLRERSEMLDVLAHEVRQPLHNASAALQEANAALAVEAQSTVREPLARAKVVLSEVQASIDNRLAVASLLARGQPAHRGDVDIDTLVDVAIADMPPGQASRVHVERLTATRTAAMDPNLMRLALRNLLSNALKFSPPDSAVTLRISDQDEPPAVIFDIVDAGPGIDADRLPRLFDQEPGSTQGAGRRHGLGLFIVRRVMELHGGSVTVERNSEHGTTMRLVSPQGAEE